MLAEFNAATSRMTGAVDADRIRRKYLTALSQLTGRSTVLYMTDYLGAGGVEASIKLSDMQGLMEVLRGLPGPELDLIIDSPGGDAEATDRMVRYIRSRFDHVRVFIPLAAMSAATMWAMAADEIVMGKHSQLGPIDPQIGLPGGTLMPAGALIQQFEQATEECEKEPARITGWLPTLQQYPPGLLSFCESAAKLSKNLVAEWLEAYMLKGRPDAHAVAQDVANWLADDQTHLSHARALTIDQLQAKGLPIVALEDDQALQDAVLSVYHATVHTFTRSNAVKIIENNLGRAYVITGAQMMISAGGPPPGPAPLAPPPAAPSPLGVPTPAGPRNQPSRPSRQERRAKPPK